MPDDFISADDFTAALKGDEKAQLRTMVRSLAIALRMTNLYIKNADIRRANIELARAALEYLESQS